MGNGHSGDALQQVGGEIQRIVGTAGASAGALTCIVASPAQHRRLIELISTHDFGGLIHALSNRARFEPTFFPNWVRRAGGYFPKFAQVLAVRPDLIRNPEVLDSFARCLEDMPPRPIQEVRNHLLRQNWEQASVNGVGEVLNVGSVAQVNSLALADGATGVVKVAWPDTRERMVVDFRLFSHARQILAALKLTDEKSKSVAAMFEAVGKNEAAVMKEFDLVQESSALRVVAELCANEWPAVYRMWQSAVGPALATLPQQISVLATVAMGVSSTWSLRIPLPIPGFEHQLSLAMTLAGGVSMQRLLDGSAAGSDGQQVVAGVLVGYAVPFLGWLLLCKSTSHLAHGDPHPGNFRWDNDAQELWVLDWGCHIKMRTEQRRALCLLMIIIANDGDDQLVADTARSCGVMGQLDGRLARVVRGMLNATSSHAARDALNEAAVDSLLDDISEEAAPVVRCLATLGGMLKALQQTIRDRHDQDVPLSLPALWQPFAVIGLES